ncbi:hypothetical protein FRAHR75_1630006 [Frankia sp. Hr75.2]|nr:hypothetical protein FRAHR75_1630006 [Frankia sp. Hr75.2]
MRRVQTHRMTQPGRKSRNGWRLSRKDDRTDTVLARRGGLGNEGRMGRTPGLRRQVETRRRRTIM